MWSGSPHSCTYTRWFVRAASRFWYSDPAQETDAAAPAQRPCLISGELYQSWYIVAFDDVVVEGGGGCATSAARRSRREMVQNVYTTADERAVEQPRRLRSSSLSYGHRGESQVALNDVLAGQVGE
jgi:hypothetical protein